MTLSSLLGALPGAMSQGLIWGIMAIGVFITFKVLDIADLTVDGTLCTGGAVCVVLIIGGYPMWLAILLATLAGMAAGLCTGLFHTLFGIPAILAGILTQFALWSVNLRILGGANQAISADKYDLLTSLRYLGNSNIPFWKNPLVMISVFLVVVIALLYWFFGTEMGCSLRATGANQNMARAQGINTDFCKVLGLMVSNGLVGLSGALLSQYQGFADINMGRGSIVIGGNGAGKSTLMNAIAGAWPVDEGSIIIDGVDVTKLSEHKRAAFIGRVFQDPMMGTAATMGIEENLALAKRRGKVRTLRTGITRAEREEYRELLKTLGLGLEDRMISKVGLLSGGQRQALTLLMATLIRPKLLLLDEHTAALDPKTAAKVLQATDRIIERDHLTTLMITHNMRDAIVHGNRLIMMHEGRVILDIRGEEKKRLTVEDLMHEFEKASGEIFASDKALLG